MLPNVTSVDVFQSDRFNTSTRNWRFRASLLNFSISFYKAFFKKETKSSETEVMWDNVDRYSSEGCLFLGVCPRNVFLKNEWANIRDSLWSFKDHCLEVEKAKDDLELNSVELPVLSFTNLSPTTSLSAPLSTKEQVTCWKSLSSPNHQHHSSRNHLHLEEQGAVFQLTIETSTDPDPPLVIVVPPPPPPEIVVELLVIVISPPPPPGSILPSDSPCLISNRISRWPTPLVTA